MGKTRKGKTYVPQDAGYRDAKKRGFVARSALKLEEIDVKHKIFKRGMKILDMGCAPGSWLQYASTKSGKKAQLVGFDLEDVRIDLPNVTTYREDLSTLTVEDERIKELLPFDLIQSDAMVKTTGIAFTDCSRSIALVEAVLDLARSGALRYGGSFVAKIFEGPGFTEFYTDFKKLFAKNAVQRPESSREGSREVYVIGKEFRGLKK